ncbi:hypothetical protein BTW08_01740 [Salinicola sp. MH3R3-1]|uniref:hypothetical protein n=1 Tax=Salinicola sp. MH3R3-1 TaxID=1928762 RepID=UPI00094F397C|nr:hypothetical protein [Salinicola sp. MH3R3-1]OLO09444.1 hypothetical protein BTW08_01740 [Salinicola sp. MH3R3-1]
MASSVNSDQGVKSLEKTGSNAGATEWLATLVKAVAAGKSEGKESGKAKGTGGKDDAEEVSGDSDLSVDEIRKKYDIPDFSDDGLLEVKVGDDKTVGEKAAEDFINGIRDDVKSGKLAEDSDEAKLVDLIDAQGATENGYDLYGYVELMESGGSTYRQTQTDPTHLTGDDAKAIIDEDELAKQISGLMQKEGISKRYDDALQGAIESIPEDTRTDIADRVDKALFEPDSKDPNPGFEDYVIAMKEKAEATDDEELTDKLQDEVDNYFEALQALEPDSYKDRKQTFDQNMMTHQLDSYMENPDSVDAENASIGLRDTIDIVQAGVNSTLQSLDKSDKSYNAYQTLNKDLESFKQSLPNLSPEGHKQLAKALQLATEVTNRPGINQNEKNKLFQSVINDNLKSLPEAERGTFKKLLDSASSTGTLGAMSGTMSLISGGMQISNGGWDDMSTDERVAAVRDLVGALSFGNDFARFGSNLIEQLSGKVDVPGVEGGVPRAQATSWLGLLGDNFPDIWRSGADAKADLFSEAISTRVNKASENLGNQGIPLDDLDENGRKNFEKLAENLGNQMIDTGSRTSGGDIAKNAGRSFLRFMGGAGLDITGGVMDLVSGVKKLKDADTALERAGAGLQIGLGASGTGMAIANTVSMFAPSGSNLAANIGGIGTRVMSGVFMGARVAGPVLGVVGTIFGIAGTLIAEAINHKKLQKLTDSQGQFFKDLSEYGVTEEDWGDKLEFARYESYMYGGRDSPDDQSIFEYQADEWEHFQNTEGEKGSSLPRLAPHLHKDGDPDEKNLWEKHLDGGTTRQNGKDSYYKTDDWRPWGDTDTEILDPADESGLPRYGDSGGAGTFSDFREDIDRVDIGSIELVDDGRVVFVKDGVRQIIDPEAGDSHSDKETRTEIIDYLKGLYDLAHPDGERSQQRIDEMDSVFAQTDRYNDVDAIGNYIEAEDPAAWDEKPDVVNIFGDKGSPGNFGDFKEDMDKVDVASIRVFDNGEVYFKKSGTWYVLTPNANSKIDGEFDKFTGYLKELYDITHDDGVLNKRLAAQVDELFGSTDDYNDLDDLKKFLDIA